MGRRVDSLGTGPTSSMKTPQPSCFSAARRWLLSLLLGEEGLQFHQFLYQKGIQLSTLQCCLLGSGEAARHLDLPSSSPLPWDGEILKFQNALPLLLADGDERTVSFLRLLKDGL